VFNATFSNISGMSWRPVLVMEETGVPGENHKLQKGCTRLAAASDKDYQLLAHGRWFSPGTPVSSITKTGRHDIPQPGIEYTLEHMYQMKWKTNIFSLLF
jgi:hypothetical protein